MDFIDSNLFNYIEKDYKWIGLVSFKDKQWQSAAMQQFVIGMRRVRKEGVSSIISKMWCVSEMSLKCLPRVLLQNS